MIECENCRFNSLALCRDQCGEDNWDDEEEENDELEEDEEEEEE